MEIRFIMRPNNSLQVSSGDLALMSVAAAVMTFIMGYTIVRVSLAYSEGPEAPGAIVNPVAHAATLWSADLQD